MTSPQNTRVRPHASHAETTRSVLSALLLCALVGTVSGAGCETRPSQNAAEDRLPVIVNLRMAPAVNRGGEIDPAWRRALERKQQAVISRLRAATGSTEASLAVKTFMLTPAIALQASRADLAALRQDPDVADVVADQPSAPSGF